MVSERQRSIIDHLRSLAEAAEGRDALDVELVDAFIAHHSEAAFAALVRRHGPMVLNVCRRVLGNHQDAEDAFQATFLVLARKAGDLRDRPRVGSWLYGVAHRTASKALTARARRAAHERATVVPPSRDPVAELTVSEAQRVVDEELAKLPEKFRGPLVLCCLEGLARDEAAKQLGCPAGLVKSRLEQGRELLRGRLARRGLTLPAGMLAVGLLGSAADAAIPAALIASITRAAVGVATGGSAAGIVSAQALALSEGMVRMMFLAKVKLYAAVLLAVLGLGALAAAPLLARKATEGGDPQPPQAARNSAAGGERGAKAGPPTALNAEALERWGKGEAVVTANLVAVQAGPVGLSEPPIYNHTLKLNVIKSLRGTFKQGDAVNGHHAIKQAKSPTFPLNKECLVSLKRTRNGWQVGAIREAKADEIAQAQLACAVPLGWTMVKGRLLSPWAALGNKAWPARARAQFVCAETGRPALLAGDGVAFTVEPVPPKVAIKYTNPDGDGDYRITVKNTTAKEVTVPALLRVGDKILWDESLVILCQGKVYTVPGARGVKEAAQPAVLKPGESLSTVVNALKLQGPQWPRGGYRIEFQFALGEKSATHSFYYTSRHHDRVRDGFLGKGGAETKK